MRVPRVASVQTGNRGGRAEREEEPAVPEKERAAVEAAKGAGTCPRGRGMRSPAAGFEEGGVDAQLRNSLAPVHLPRPNQQAGGRLEEREG
eukprot:scaffold4335_cov62-Isochrysis_galbana.AAC.1